MRRKEAVPDIEFHQHDIISESEIQRFVELARRDAALTHALRAALDEADIVKTIETGSELSGPGPTLAQTMLPEALQFSECVGAIIAAVEADDDRRIVSEAKRLLLIEVESAARRQAAA